MVRKIGEGQFGSVKLCKDADGNQFAVKVMNKALKQQSMRTQSVAGKAAMVGVSAGNEFSNVEYEIAIMKKIQHPHVVRLTEVINDPNHDKVFLVMEYVSGGAVCGDIEPVEPLVSCRETSRFESNETFTTSLGLIFVIFNFSIVVRSTKCMF